MLLFLYTKAHFYALAESREVQEFIEENPEGAEAADCFARNQREVKRQLAIANMTYSPTDLQHEIEMLEDMKERMDGITLDEVNAAMEFTEPVMEVYRQIMPIAKKSANKKATQSAAMSVLVFCSHVQAFVEILHKSGYKNYTPADYFKSNPVVLDFDGSGENVWDSRKVYGTSDNGNMTGEGVFNMPLRDEDKEIIKINGLEEFAEIKEDIVIDENTKLPAGPISLYLGYQIVRTDDNAPKGGFGLAHFIYKHGDYLKNIGYEKDGKVDFERAILDVFGECNEVFLSNKKANEVNEILVYKSYGLKDGLKIVLAYDKDNARYSIATIAPVVENQAKKLSQKNKKIDLSFFVHPTEQTQQPAAAPLSYPDGTKSGTTERPLLDKRNDKSIVGESLSDIQKKSQ